MHQVQKFCIVEATLLQRITIREYIVFTVQIESNGTRLYSLERGWTERSAHDQSSSTNPMIPGDHNISLDYLNVDIVYS